MCQKAKPQYANKKPILNTKTNRVQVKGRGKIMLTLTKLQGKCLNCRQDIRARKPVRNKEEVPHNNKEVSISGKHKMCMIATTEYMTYRLT